jgi:hypothetical protein
VPAPPSLRKNSDPTAAVAVCPEAAHPSLRVSKGHAEAIESRTLDWADRRAYSKQQNLKIQTDLVKGSITEAGSQVIK